MQTLISIKMPQEMIDKLKELAKAKGVGYQTLIKMILDVYLNENS